MEAPLKFQAPGVTLSVGLSIGRLIFHTLNYVEILLAIVLAAAIYLNRPVSRLSKLAFAVIIVLLGLETAWLLPALDVRAQAVIDGTGAPYSSMHLVYILFDAVKVVTLLVLGITLTKQMIRGSYE